MISQRIPAKSRRCYAPAAAPRPAGYLAATQTPDGVIHLISSRLHYRFNLAWLQQPNAGPAEGR